MDLNLKLIAGEFFDNTCIPRGKEYLLHYFRGELQERFLAYYIHFHSLIEERGPKAFYDAFYDNTGLICVRKVLRRYIRRYKLLEDLVEKYKQEGDLEKLLQIQTGKFKLKFLGDRDR